jgi:hypothetical protein
MATYSLAAMARKLFFVVALLITSVIFFGGKHVSALSDNFPEGHSVYNEWVMLSQYQCPGHCLDTPKADIRIFYKNSTMDAQGIGANTSLEVDVQVDCRYNGTPDGSASLSGGTTRNGWPYVTCTGLNTSSGASATQAFNVQRKNLNCSESGSTQAYPGWCYANLHLAVNNNSGNQPVLGAWISSGDGLGGVRITAQEEDNPGQNYANSDCYTGAGGSCSPSGGPPRSDHLFTLWNNYASNGPDTHHNWDLTFAPDCTVKSNKTVYLRWYDADDGGSGNNGTQSGQISFDLHDDTANSYIFNNRGGLGGNDSYRDLGFTIKPGHQYTWAWNNVSATNGIQLWIPYSEMSAHINCPPPPGSPPPGQNPVAGTVSCSASVDNSNPFLGQTVTITVTVTNESNATDWWIGTNNTNFGYSNNPSAANYPPSPPDITKPPYVANNYLHHYPHTNPAYPDVVNDGSWHTKEHSVVFLETGVANALNAPQNTSRLGKGQTSFAHTYTATNTNPGVTTSTYHFGVRNDETGAYFPTSNGNSVCDVSVNWSAVSLSQYGCTDTSVYDPGGVQYYFVFTDAAGNLVHNTGLDPGGVFSTSRDFNTFVDFPYLYPHGFYYIHIYQWGSNTELDSPVAVAGCMAAQCETNLTADLEPGQSGNVTYGVYLANYTGRTYNAGEYGVLAQANPGLVGSGSTPIVFAANPNLVAYDVTFNVQALYGGSITAHVLFGGVPIDGQIPYTPCSPPYNPQTRATMRVTHGDISTGGGFQYNNSCATNFSNSKPRYVSPFTTTNDTAAGGLRTFSIPQNFQGSGSDFAAYALGYITGTAPGNDGFFTAASKTGIKTYNDLMFANTPAPPGNNLGGLLGGDSMAAHCAVDYFMGTRINDLGTPQNSGQITLNGKATGQYLYKDNGGGLPCLRIKGQVDPGARITIYTDDDVCINDNISYSNWSIDTTNLTNTAPYLTVITRGSIYVQSNVVNIAGLFIAQSDDDGAGNVTGGVFASCANGAAVANSAYLKGNCHSQLTVNGSVIAQRVYPLRATGGTLFNNTGTAETFDYAPSMIIGQPNLKPLCEGAAVDLCKETESNLPPVF